MLVPGMAEEGGGKTGHSLPMDRDWKVRMATSKAFIEFIRLELLALVLGLSPPTRPPGTEYTDQPSSITPQPCNPRLIQDLRDLKGDPKLIKFEHNITTKRTLEYSAS